MANFIAKCNQNEEKMPRFPHFYGCDRFEITKINAKTS